MLSFFCHFTPSLHTIHERAVLPSSITLHSNTNHLSSHRDSLVQDILPSLHHRKKFHFAGGRCLDEHPSTPSLPHITAINFSSLLILLYHHLLRVPSRFFPEKKNPHSHFTTFCFVPRTHIHIPKIDGPPIQTIHGPLWTGQSSVQPISSACSIHPPSKRLAFFHPIQTVRSSADAWNS